MRRADLNGPEQRVWDALVRGELVDLRDGYPVGERLPRQVIRAQVLAALLVADRPADTGRSTRLAVVGARIAGALNLRDAKVTAALGLTECLFEEEVAVAGAAMGHIDLSGSILPGLQARQVKVDGDLWMADCRLAGAVQLEGAQVAGVFCLDRADLSTPGATALHAARLRVDHGIRADRLCARGQVRLTSARITGSLELVNAQIAHPGGEALDLRRIVVTDDLTCIDGCRVEGRVTMGQAHVEGDLNLAGVQLVGHDGIALAADGLTVDNSLRLGAEFAASGDLVLAGARLGTLEIRPTQPMRAALDLRHARIGLLRDDPTNWPRSTRLDGLTYESLNPLLSAKDRLIWLRTQNDGYLPQPYEQLAKAYRGLGHDHDARHVLLAKHRHRRTTLTPGGKLWGYAQDWTVGYGYQPGRAALWFCTLLAVGTVAFMLDAPARVAGGPRFNPLVYTLDVLLPIGGFDQQKTFAPATTTGHWLAYALTAAGGILATTVVAAVTRSLSRP
jgi:hypothetical protein